MCISDRCGCVPSAWLGCCRLILASSRARHCCTPFCPRLGSCRPQQEVRLPFGHVFFQKFSGFAFFSLHNVTISSHHMAPSASSQSPIYLPRSQCWSNSSLPSLSFLPPPYSQCPKEISPFLLFTDKFCSHFSQICVGMGEAAKCPCCRALLH